MADSAAEAGRVESAREATRVRAGQRPDHPATGRSGIMESGIGVTGRRSLPGKGFLFPLQRRADGPSSKAAGAGRVTVGFAEDHVAVSGQNDPPGRAPAVIVTREAIFIEDWLNFGPIAEETRLAEPWLELFRFAGNGARR